MKYVLNKLPVRTTEHFYVNDLKIDLDIKESNNYDDYSITGDTSKLKIKKEIKSLNTKMGLNFKKALVLNIDVLDNTDVVLKYHFDNNDTLLSEIILNYKEDVKANFIIKFYSNNNINKNVLKLTVKGNNNSTGNISIIDLLNNNSENYINIESYLKDNANIKTNLIEIGSKIKLSNFYSDLGNNSHLKYNIIYLGDQKDIIDINNYIGHKGLKSNSSIKMEGALKGMAHKTMKSTIDFLEGCKKSSGEEYENCLLLSDTCISRSAPLLLCHEEDVSGAHGASSGKIIQDKLFYLMSRGLTLKEANKLLVLANFNSIINEINDCESINEVERLINKLV